MKQLAMSVISIAILTGAAVPAAISDVHEQAAVINATPSIDEVTPFDLVYLAYRGELK